jgi:signal transduction histidine kinase
MRKLWLLLIWQVSACLLALGQQDAPAPARVVTSYALTSVPDLWDERDPSAWRLLASNDGQTWTQLDLRTNQLSVRANYRKLFHISNQTPYRIYRLAVDENVTHSAREVGLAEIELMGPVVGVAHEADLQAQITSSQEQPMMGAAINAFDGELKTKWLDFAPFQSGCWIQCEYVRRSELLMTNVNQVRMVTGLMATPTLLLEKAPQILSNLAVSATGPSRTLTGYALTSANDFASRDPSDWRLLGSDDGGQTWETVDVRRNVIFSTRLHRRIFELARPATFAVYRLQMRVGLPDVVMQLAELEPLYSDPLANDRFSLVISSAGDNPPMEKTEMAFDHDSRTKWLCFNELTNDTVWIQWQCLPKVEGLPLINLDQFKHLLSRGHRPSPVPPLGRLARTLTSYTLVSANDEPSRDPFDWRLLGSNDAGKTWETLDQRQHEIFSDRLQRRSFELPKPKPCTLYRLQFDSVLAPTNTGLIQLADIEPVYAAEPVNRNYSLVVSAEGDNPPLEGMENLFDGNPKTKWLAPSNDPKRASWVQWYFAGKENLPVIRADSTPAVQPGLPQVLTLQLEGVAVCADSNLLGFLDHSGFQIFQSESPLPAHRAGDRVRLSGQLRFGREFPLVQNPQLVVLGAVTNLSEISSHQAFDSKMPFAFGSVEGRVTSVSEEELDTTLQLAPAPDAPSLTVKILNPRHRPLPALVGRRLRAQGVIEPVLDEQNGQSPGLVWVAGTNHLTFVSPADSPKPMGPQLETNELTSIHQIIETLKIHPDQSFHVKVRGVITYVDLGYTGWYLQDGPDAIYVQQQYASGLSPYLRQEGMYVELQGLVGGTNGRGIRPSEFVKLLGKGRMPQPFRHTFDYLATGNDDGNWVQVVGVVTASETHHLTLNLPGGQLVAWINEANLNDQDRLLGSLVRVSGVCGPVFNGRQQRLGLRLLVPSAEYIEIIVASPEKPFDLPVSPIGSLMQSDPRRPGLATKMVKITGVVTYAEPLVLFVQNQADAVRVFPREKAVVKPGDSVEVVGLTEPDGLSPKLVQALIRKTGRMPLPAPNPISVQRMTAEDNQTSQDAIRGSVDAIFLGRSANESVQILQLQQEQTKTPFYAYLPGPAESISYIPIGSHLHLVGAFKARSDAVPDFGQVVTSFEMYLNSPADILVLERPPWWTPRHTLWLLGGFGAVLLAVLAWVGLLRLQVGRRTGELHKVINQHEQTEAQLQAEIGERKRMEIEVEKAHLELLDSSRHAGMAEVATSVLHNVGNVLNSVNIAAGIVADNLRKSRGASLAKVAGLMDEHAADLGQFITSDPQGRHIPSYLTKLAAHLDSERATTLVEVQELRQNIEHIKEIVVMQQNFARVVGVTEIINATELVDNALRINAASLIRHNVKVIRNYDPHVPKITVEKHKLLQILVNLISNAKHACVEAGRQDKEITVRVDNRDGRLLISVRDNGIGIPPENLTRIFNHGFTTRKDGHGFGLHSGALTAKEMGGALIAQSDGPGKGANFTIELPFSPKTPPEKPAPVKGS